jgi:copper transport protein
MIRRTLMVSILALAGVALLAAPALAHANLLSSDPANGTTVPTAPSQVSITFSEPPDPTLSSIQVLDPTGAQHQVGSPAVAPGDPTTLIEQVGSLADGVYTVAWQTVSKTDGHVAGNTFAFGVGNVHGSVKPSLNIPAPTTPPPAPLGVIGRFALYVGLSILFAAGALGIAVFSGVVPGGRLTLWAGWVLAAAGTAATIVVEHATVGASWRTLLASGAGEPLVRLAGAVVLLLPATSFVARRPRWTSLAMLAIVAAVAMLVRAMGGHAGTSVLQITLQWLHLLAVATWVGGLILMLLRLRATSETPLAQLERFSTVAGYALLAVAVTGTLRAIHELGGLSAWRRLFEASYGITLAIKVAVAVVLIGFGALNRYRNLPSIRAGGAPTGIRRSIAAEVTLAVGIFALTGLLTGLPPQVIAQAQPATPSALTVNGSDFATTVRVRLQIDPGTVGPNDYRVQLTGYDTGAPVAASGVTLTFQPKDARGVGSSSLDLDRSGSAWIGSGPQLSLDTTYAVTVLVGAPSGAVEIPLTVTPRIDEQVSVATSSNLPDLYTITLPSGIQFQTYNDPGAVGSNQLHVTAFDAKGNELPLTSIHVTADGPSAGPQPVPLTPFDQIGGHYAGTLQLTAGSWSFAIDAVAKDGTKLRASFDQTIGG